MDPNPTISSLSEAEFASLVSTIAADPARRNELTELLHEDHSIYDERGAATAVRMRGWLLHTLSQVGVSDEALVFILEELDTGTDPYLVAAAARAVRSYSKPSSALAPFVMRAISNIRYRDEPVSFDEYGEYVDDSSGTSPVRELLATLAWLGSNARVVLPDLESIKAQPHGLSKKRLVDLERTLEAIRGAGEETESCCELPRGLKDKFSWGLKSRRSCDPIESTVFEDQNNEAVTFGEFFCGQPSIAVFFYTRCDNPLKCSLTVTKLARIQNLLSERGLANQINTAAITYDPEFDMPERIRGYGQNRGVRLDSRNRMLRAQNGIESIRRHFKLGVNFIESLVNRHRVEVYILDAKGQIASVFERIHWNEQEVVDRAIEVLNETQQDASEAPEKPVANRKTSSPIFGALASVALAFFPKCPICWAAYLSFFGIAGLDRIPYSPWLQPMLATAMLINLASVWLRARATGRMIAFYLVSAGALIIIASKLGNGWEGLAMWGVGLTLTGSVLSALGARRKRSVDVPA